MELRKGFNSKQKMFNTLQWLKFDHYQVLNSDKLKLSYGKLFNL